MPTLDDYKDFFAVLRKRTGIEALAPDDAGLVSVRVQDEYNLNFQFVKPAGKILCFVEVADLPKDAGREVYRELLAAGLFGLETAGGHFTLAAETETVVYDYLFDFEPAAGGARKEHMTAGMKTALKRATEKLKAAGRADLAAILTSRNVTKGGSMMLFDNLFKAIDAEPKNAVLQEVVNDLVAAAKADIGDKHGRAVSRLGNEVMIDEGDLTAFAPPAHP